MVYQIIASPVMLAVALRLDSTGTLPGPTLWTMLACGNVVLLAGMALMACYMVPKYRETFYKVGYSLQMCISQCPRYNL